MTPLRLLFVVQRYGPQVRGGAEQAAREVAERLAGLGHHVEVLSTTARSYVDWSGDLPAGSVLSRGVLIHRLSVDPLRDHDAFDRLHHRMSIAVPPLDTGLQRAWVRAQGPSVPDLIPWLDRHAGRFDVVVCFTYLYATTTDALPAASRHTATALVPCAHDEVPLALPAFDRSVHLADACLFLTPEEASLVRHRFRLRTPHHVVGLGAELDAPMAPPASLVAAGVGERPYLLYVGRIDPSKGTSWLVDGFRRLQEVDPTPLQLVLLGEPVVPPAPHPDVVVLAGADDATRNAALAGAVALVHPSPHESFGMVVVEAWAVGTPVIAFGGNAVLRGHVERSGGGLLVESTAELGAAARLLAGDRALRDRLGQAGRRHVEAHHTWPRVTAAWERALRRTATAGRARPVIRASAGPPRAEPAPALSPAAADPARTVAGPARPRADHLPPAWLARPLTALVGLVTAACVVGVLAAVLGAFTPAVVIAGAIVLGLPAAYVATQALPSWSSGRSAHASAALVVVAVAGLTLWNGLHHGEHLVADRDPGVYVTTARHLMDAGDLLVPGPVGPFADAAGVYPNSAGFSPARGDGTLEAQFPHLTAVVLALAGWVDEGGLFVVTPVVAGVGLLLLYAWATTVIGPRWAAVATVLAGTTMPSMVFARDAYSEPITTVVVFGGLWLLHLAARCGRDPVWFLAGLTLGVANMARVDSFLYLAPIAGALVVTARLGGGSGRAAWRPVGWCALGYLATSALGLWDTATLTGGYYEQALAPRLPDMVAAAVVAGLVGLTAPLLWRRTADGAGRVPTTALRAILVATVAGCVVFFAWARWVRPDPEGLPPVAVEGLNVLSYLPQAATLSMLWLEWYLGPIGLAAALVGLLWLVLHLGRSTAPEPALLAGLGAILVTLLTYLWSPNITPDQPWAMRRFAAVALPGLAVGVGATCRALWSFGRGRSPGRRLAVRPVGAALAAAVLAAAAVASTVVITWPTRSVRAQEDMRARMAELCAAVGDDAAILVPIDGLLALMLSVPVGVWCDVPSAGGTVDLESEDVARLAVAWAAEGRRLVLVSSSATPMMNTLVGTGLVGRTLELDPLYPKAIEPTITARPRQVVVDGRVGKGPDGELTFYLYEIDVRAAGRVLGTSSTSGPGSDAGPAVGE